MYGGAGVVAGSGLSLLLDDVDGKVPEGALYGFINFVGGYFPMVLLK